MWKHVCAGVGIYGHLECSCLYPSLFFSGPQAFCIPGNHDWYDGLETYIRMICCSKWLGGWLLPQTTSYFALKLPHNWWIFGCDNGLAEDMDVPQFQYFSWVCVLAWATCQKNFCVKVELCGR